MNQEHETIEKHAAIIKETIAFQSEQFRAISAVSFEAMKHLTTLSTGSVLLLVTFLEKLFAGYREWTGLIGVALVSFVLSIVAAMWTLMQASTTLSFEGSRDVTRFVELQKSRKLTETIAFGTFLLGVVCLCVFALQNLY
jgi:hypothetical protein